MATARGTAKVATKAATPARKPAPRKRAAPKAEPVKPNTFTAESRQGMTFTYEETTAPVVIRTSRREKEINPHSAGIDRAIVMFNEDIDNQATKRRALEIAVPTADVKKHSHWLRKGGNESDVSIIITPAVISEGENGLTKLNFYAVKRITRPRKATVEAIANGGEAATPAQAGF